MILAQPDAQQREGAELAQDFHKLFASLRMRGPRLDLSQYHNIAIAVQVARYAWLAGQDPVRRVREELERNERERRKKIFESLYKMISSTPQLDVAGRHALMEASSLLERSLLPASDPLESSHADAKWHKPARFIANQVRLELVAAGHRKVSFQKHGQLVVLIADLLKMATGLSKQPATIAAALRNLH